ncbi:DUF4123 domain-containing protein [uncultured Tateyamaria sp.]|uniref:DUF4123 domain-containing protein n=1 Tax=Tateyamaria sp. 1078 TaxID=3417464 RepID=UPI00260D89B0|nr:DUF4123 domain-containing protein [uncultured Tateyamaria sp.]
MSDTPRTDSADDPWRTGGDAAQPCDADGAGDRDFAVNTLEGIVPLDPQFGVIDPQVVPETLEEITFGGAADQLTYAILDAARIDGLAERLENAGLPHACLFSNTDDLGGVAPWLVEIDRAAPLTRQMFTDGEGPRALWRTDAGVLLRTVLPLADLRAHLRRFTQVRMAADADPVFFRFWDPRVMSRYLHSHDPEAREAVTAMLGGTEIIAIDRHNARAVHATVRAPRGRPPRIWPKLRTDLSPIRLEIFCEDLADRIATDIPPLADVPRAERREIVTGLVQAARGIDLRLDKSVTRYVFAALMIGGQPETDPRFADIIDSPRHELDRSRQILNLAKAV